MKITAVQKSIRQSPRKVRLVANTIKNLPLEQAILQLGALQRRSSLVVLKTLRQAIANAQHNHGINMDGLEIDSIVVGEGVRYKRYRAVSRGRAHSIVKRTCRVVVTLKTMDDQNTTKQTKEPSKKQSKVTTKPATSQPTPQKQSKKPLASAKPVQPTSAKPPKQSAVVTKSTRTKRPVAK